MKPVLALGVLALCAAASAREGRTVIRSIRFSGAEAIGTRELRGAMASSEGNLLSAEQLASDAESIVKLYRSKGYYQAGAFPEGPAFTSDSAMADITITIREGERALVAAVRLTGNGALSPGQLLSGFETKAGSPLDGPSLERDIDRVLSSYERAGRPFARVEVENITLERDSAGAGLDVDLRIDEGPAVTVDEITVTGNRETKDRVILREARLRLHEPYDEEKVRRIGDRLKRLGLFAGVSGPDLYLRQGPAGGSGGLLINVEEGNTSTFDGILGYAPAGPGGGEGTISGIVTVSMRNLFGTARRLDVHWERDNSLSQEIALQYSEPWAFDLPVTLTSGFRQREQDSTYIARGFDAKADLLITESVTLGGAFSHSAVIPSSGPAGEIVSNSRTVTAGLDLRVDTRDQLMSPSSGALYRSSYRIGAKKLYSSGTDETVQTVGLDADMYLSTFERQVIAIGLHGRQISADRIELSDCYRFGGTNTLRGYRENEFLGSRVAWTNTEYRFLLARRSYFFGFIDTGYFYLPDLTTPAGTLLALPGAIGAAAEKFKAGYGIGIRMETAVGAIGVSIAFGQGDSFSEGKLHFGLANDF